MAPSLSIIVTAQEARHTIVPCINSLLSQAASDDLQIIIVDGSRDGTAELAARQFPGLQLLQQSPPCSLPHLLGLGIKAAQGDIIAVTEAHCVFPPGWFRAVVTAHRRYPGPVIGGAVEPGPELGWSDWALYFADYGRFMQPLTPGPASEMPGENVSFKRAALEKAQSEGSDFVRDGFWKTFFCNMLRQTGHSLLAAPEVVVFYNRRLTARQIVNRRLTHGRCYGGRRARQVSLPRRTLIALGGWLLPPLLAVRLWSNVWPKGRYRREFILSLPISLAAIIAWSAGEWWGNLLGIGNSCDHV